MKMKTKKYFITALTAAIFALGGCNDDAFLKEVPKTFYTVENSFNTLDQVNANVTNLYVHIRYWFQINLFQKGAGTDILDTPEWRGSPQYSNFSDWSTDYSHTYSVFEALYQLISFANMTIYGANSGNLEWDDINDYNYIIAQAKFFRGFAYLTLGECYGGVSLVDEVITTPRFDFTRATREETYQFAIKDFEEALEGLPNYPPEAGRVAKGAAYHYLSEAYLALAIEQGENQASLQQSVNYASEAMGLHSLMTERFGTRATPGYTETMNGVEAYYPDGDVFFDLFQRGNLDYAEGNMEALWTFQNSYELQTEYGGDNYLPYPRNFSPVMRDTNWKTEYRENDTSSPWPGDISAHVGGKGVSFFAPTNYAINGVWEDKYWEDMRNNELNIRREFLCTDPNHSMYGQVVPVDMLEEATLGRYYPVWTKLAPIDDWGYEQFGYDASNGHDNMYRDDYACRLAETYLLRAEAYLRLNNKAAAAEDINALRRRAKCAYEVTESDVDLNLILDERVRELFGEERRWATLLRMGGTVATDQIGEHAYYIADYPLANKPTGWNLFPYPQKVIDSNLDAVLGQNPGW